MKSVIRAPLGVALLGGCLLAACTPGDPASDAVSGNAAVKAPTGDPCALLIDDEVSKAFPGAASGQRNHSLDAHGILTCTWETPTDRFVVQVFDAKSGTVADELRGRMSGSIDPTMAGANGRVRYETVDGIGDDAMLVLEKADPKGGILADTAVLVTQRGVRRAVLFTGSSLAGADRASARATFETLGRHVADRL
jgi:hypothetical protein